MNKFKGADTVLILSYSLIMLNTDAHNPQVFLYFSSYLFPLISLLEPFLFFFFFFSFVQFYKK